VIDALMRGRRRYRGIAGSDHGDGGGCTGRWPTTRTGAALVDNEAMADELVAALGAKADPNKAIDT